MLLRFEDYKEEYPKREMQTILKFKDYPKQLHEMTLEEINEAVASWNPLAPKTAIKQKSQISLYLQWLNEKGVATALNPQDARYIELPITEDEAYLIYSTADMFHYYDLLFQALERGRVANRDIPQDEAFWLCRAAGVLSFYGLTKEQILDLDLSDVQSDGVIGYDLPLTDDDIEALLAYKSLNVIGRGARLLGTKYVRSTKAGMNPTEKTLDAILWRAQLSPKDKYLLKILTTSNMYILGKYNRVYQYEAEHGVRVDGGKIIPQWFKDIFSDLTKNALVANRKEYIKYRKERSKVQPVTQKAETGLSKKEKEEINTKLSELSAQASAIFAEMAKLKDKLK